MKGQQWHKDSRGWVVEQRGQGGQCEVGRRAEPASVVSTNAV